MRKVFFGILVTLFVAGIAYLSLTSSRTLATSSAGRITEAEYYKKVENSQAGQQMFANMVINKVLDAKYGKEVSKQEVEDAFKTQKASYGPSFATVLASNGMTEAQYKDSIRQNLVLTAAIKANHKISEKEIKGAYDKYTPAVEVSMILVSSEDTAKKVIDELNDGAKFADLVKKYSEDEATKKDAGKLPKFDSTNTNLDKSFMEAAFKLNDGEYTKEPVHGENGYYIIKMDKKSAKKDINEYRNILQNQIIAEYMSNNENAGEIQAIVGKLLRKADVSVKDKNFKNALNEYLTAGINK